MNSNIEQKLGFDRIRQMVAEQCTNTLAARMADEMHFTSDYDTLLHELQLTEEMRQIVLMESEFPQQDFIDLTHVLTHLRVGNTFMPLESMFDLKLSLRTIRECYRFLTAEEHQQYTALRNLAVEVELGYGGKSSQLNVINSLLGKLIDDRDTPHQSPQGRRGRRPGEQRAGPRQTRRLGPGRRRGYHPRRPSRHSPAHHLPPPYARPHTGRERLAPDRLRRAC